MDPVRKIDLHMHTTFSDGTDTPEEILQHVKEAGIVMFSVTDHDSVKGAGVMEELRSVNDPVFINGVEFSCKDEDGQYHILGYGYDPGAEPVRKLAAAAHALRMKKIRRRLEIVRDEYGCIFPEEEIERLLHMDNPGKPHIANLMVRFGYAESKDWAMKEVLNRIHFPTDHFRPEDAIEAIRRSRGVPVLAHPFYGSGDQLILGEEMEQRLKKLMGMGLEGVEAFYSGFTVKLRNTMLRMAEQNGLYVTAGSDYHGKNKLVRLGDTGLDEVEELPEGLKRFIRRITG